MTLDRHRYLPLVASFALVATGALPALGCSSTSTTTEPAPTTAAAMETTTTGTADEDEDRSGSTQPAAPTTVAPATTETTASPVAPDEQPVPTTPIALGRALTEAEAAVRDGGPDADSRAAWARRQQRLYRVMSANRSWADEALAAVDPVHAAAVATNWEARLALDALLDTSRLSDTVPAWRIAAPAPPEELLGYYREAAHQTGVPWEILAAINLIETRMGRINGISTAGALGPMQFLPSTWAECCDGDPTEDRDAIIGAARYLVDRGAATDLDRAIYGYNNSDYYVRAVRSYARVMADDPAAYYGFHGWEVYFLSTEGLLSLPVGYEEPEAVDVATWLAANPEALVDLGSSP